MKFTAKGMQIALAACAAFACLACPILSMAQGGGASSQPADYSCEECVPQPIDLGPQAKGVTAEFYVPPDVPLEFPEVHLNYLPNGGIQGGFYVVRNDSKAGLVSLTTSWFIHVDNPNAPPAPAGQCSSFWASGHAFLAPGASENEHLGFGLIPYKGHAVVRVTGIVIYAEFEDGTRLGPGVAKLYPALHARREKLLNDYHTLLTMIRAGKPDTELEAYVQTTRGLEGLELVRARKGWDGVAAEISKRLRLIGQQDR
jgi:hypothetical protein